MDEWKPIPGLIKTRVLASTAPTPVFTPLLTPPPFGFFAKSGLPFTHNGAQGPTGYNVLFAQQIHFEVDLSVWPIPEMCTKSQKDPGSQ